MNSPVDFLWIACTLWAATFAYIAAVLFLGEVWPRLCRLVEDSTAWIDDPGDEPDTFVVCDCDACTNWRFSDDVQQWENEVNA